MSDGFLSNVSFLVADDQEFVRQLVRQILGCAGARLIQEASDGEEAWARFNYNPADILLPDWEMHPMDGIELTRKVRNDKASPNAYVPIIMMTGYSEQGRVLMARDAGIHEFLIKPMSPKALFNRIEAVINRPRPFIRLANYFGPDRRRSNRPFDGKDRRKG